MELADLVPVIVAGAAPAFLLALLGPRSRLARALCAALCVAFTLRYMAWRWTASLPQPELLPVAHRLWIWVYLLVETIAAVSSVLVHLFMSRIVSRSAVVDARSDSPLLAAPVDVLIATYNEDADILERTIIGALAIDHPDLRVWVLDDGARPWVRALAEGLGARYHFRVRGQHAKAGNVNEGLRQACATGRRPEFVLMLDADFVANRRILRRTLPLFQEADVGIVQTPQHFFNPDPIQANLLCTTAWPDEQRFFFNHLLASKDAWGAAFCCGTSAVLRVAALDACGGLATATVTEDMLTSFAMRDAGFRTIFLNEPLSLGLSPEGLQEYIGQRCRWCLGAIQQIYTRWGFAGAARIGLVNRVSALDGVLFWSFGFLFKLMMLAAPLVYWWTGAAVIDADPAALLVWVAPAVLCGLIFMGALAGNTIFPFITDVTALLASFQIVRTVAVALVRPFGRPFKVTAKGIATEGVTVQWRLMAPFLVLAALTAAGMLANLSPYAAQSGTGGYALNMVWSLFNVLLLLVAASACVEPPRRRRDERFATDEPAELTCAGVTTRVRVRNLSLGGALLQPRPDWRAPGRFGVIRLAEITAPVPFEVLGTKPGGLIALRFRNDTETRRELIRKLFTGGYDNEVPRIMPGRVMVGMLRKLLG